jgi:hypothetical protein
VNIFGKELACEKGVEERKIYNIREPNIYIYISSEQSQPK